MPMPDVFVIGFKCIRRCGTLPVGRLRAGRRGLLIWQITKHCFCPCQYFLYTFALAGCAPIGEFSCKFIFNIDLCSHQNPAYAVFLMAGQEPVGISDMLLSF